MALQRFLKSSRSLGANQDEFLRCFDLDVGMLYVWLHPVYHEGRA